MASKLNFCLFVSIRRTIKVVEHMLIRGGTLSLYNHLQTRRGTTWAIRQDQQVSFYPCLLEESRKPNNLGRGIVLV